MAIVLFVTASLFGWIILDRPRCNSFEACLDSNKQVLATMGAIVVGVSGLCAWLVAQWRENDRRRFETFFKMRQEFRTNPRFGKIFQALEGDIKRVQLSEISDDDAAELAGFLEEIAILVQSGVMSKQLAHYFFGYYVIEIVDNIDYMNKIEAEGSLYWRLLREFAVTMEKEQEKLKKGYTKIIPQLRV